MKIECNGIEISLNEEVGDFTSSLKCNEIEDGIFDVVLIMKAEKESQLPEVTLSWSLPSIDFHHKWNSECMQDRALDVGNFTANYVTSRANRQAPVYSLYNLEGINTYTFALSDAVHDTRLGGTYGSGIMYNCNATVYGAKVDPLEEYKLTLRFDFRRIPYYESLHGIVKWWEEMPEYKPCEIPDYARRPLLSSWYIYEVNVDADDLEKQCGLAKECGMDVAILDDGWQTDQLEFGYQNNGDWEVSTKKFPDFAAHVKRIQDKGLKYMVWFSVPFVGVDSKAYKTMKKYLFPSKEDAKWFGFDPRFPEVREYLASKYENFVRDYNIDGLKMDFIGSIGGRAEFETGVQSGHDTASVGLGVVKLLDEVMARLKTINPDILIEFRQGYIGPVMRKYGNMFRAVDCPNSIGDNRVRTLDTRLLAGDTAVHSDPITWHPEEPPESAAMQMIHALFSAPQISLKPSEFSAVHKQMVKSYLAFWNKYREVLMQGNLSPLYPHLLYPIVTSENSETKIIAYYANMPYECENNLPEEVVIVNGTYKEELIIDAAENLGSFKISTVDCLGNTAEETSIELKSGLNKVTIPSAGYGVLERI